MKSPILAAIAALALCGTAAGQSSPVYGNQAPQPIGPDLGHPPDLDAPLWTSPREHIIPVSARNAVGLHCAADKVRLCNSRTTEMSAYRCLVFHRAKLSSSCQHAVDELGLAN